MKNIVKVRRFNDNATRLYALPINATIIAGTVVDVEYPGGKALGVAVSDSYTVDGEAEKMVADLLHFIPATLDNLKRVINEYAPAAIIWPDDAADDDTAEDDTDTNDQ